MKRVTLVVHFVVDVPDDIRPDELCLHVSDYDVLSVGQLCPLTQPTFICHETVDVLEDTHD